VWVAVSETGGGPANSPLPFFHSAIELVTASPRSRWWTGAWRSGSAAILVNVPTLHNVNNLANVRGYLLVSYGRGLYWLVDELTRVPALNLAGDTLNFSLVEAWAFLGGDPD